MHHALVQRAVVAARLRGDDLHEVVSTPLSYVCLGFAAQSELRQPHAASSRNNDAGGHLDAASSTLQLAFSAYASYAIGEVLADRIRLW